LQVLKEEHEDTVNLVGTSGVAAVWGFHHYLKYYCFCHVSWDSDQLALPEKLPSVNITITSADRSVVLPLEFLKVNSIIMLSLCHKHCLSKLA
jgi:hypothetical protein